MNSLAPLNRIDWKKLAKEREMSLDDDKIEKELQEKGLNALRLSPTIIQEQIVDEAYYVFPGTTVTICCLTLRNGYNVIGESASVSLENFHEDIGKKVAYIKARDKIWALEGYLLKSKLAKTSIETMPLPKALQE